MSDSDSVMSRRGFVKAGTAMVAGLAIAPNELGASVNDSGTVGADKIRNSQVLYNLNNHEMFLNKAYEPSDYSGMGYVVLDKNMVDGVNILTQDMVSSANTIYVVQYDFVLKEKIFLPANCILKFKGGSIANPEFTLSDNVEIENGVFLIKDQITTCITFDGDNCKIKNSVFTYDYSGWNTKYVYCIYGNGKENITIEGIEISGFNSNYHRDNTYATFCGIRLEDCSKFSLKNVYIHNITGLSSSKFGQNNVQLWPILIQSTVENKVSGSINSCFFENIYAYDSQNNNTVGDVDLVYCYGQTITNGLSVSNIVANNAGSRFAKIGLSNVSISDIQFYTEKGVKEFIYTQNVNNITITNIGIKANCIAFTFESSNYLSVSSVNITSINDSIVENVIRLAGNSAHVAISNIISENYNNVAVINSAGSVVEDVLISNSYFHIANNPTKPNARLDVSFCNCHFTCNIVNNTAGYYGGCGTYHNCIFTLISCTYGFGMRLAAGAYAIFKNCLFNAINCTQGFNIISANNNHVDESSKIEIVDSNVIVTSSTGSVGLLTSFRGQTIIKNVDLSESNSFEPILFPLDSYNGKRSVTINDVILPSVDYTSRGTKFRIGRIIIDGKFDKFVVERLRNADYSSSQEVIAYNRSVNPPTISIKYVKDILGTVPNNLIS